MNLQELISKADGGDRQAQLDLGKAHYFGEEIPQDLTKAEHYLRKASQGRLIEADFYLALIMGDEGGHNKPEEAFPKLLEIARTGLAKAQAAVGEYYLHGWGIDQDPVEAVGWFKKAANQGYGLSCFFLGMCYLEGEGITKDAKQAFMIFKKGADLNDSDSQAMLGSCYLDGIGVAKDPSLAFVWTSKAAEQGHYGAQYNLASMFESGIGVEQNYKKAAEFFKKSADQGHDEAQRCVGFYHLHGLYHEPNVEEAMKWFQASADQGNVEAKRYVEHIKSIDSQLQAAKNKIDPHCFGVAKLLLQIPRLSEDSPEMWGWLVKGKSPNKKDANKFFLACILSYHMKAEFIWPNTKKVVEQKLGDPDDLWGYVAAHSINEWMLKKKDLGLHMLETAHKRVWKISSDILKTYDGDARNIWRGKEPGDVKDRLHKIGDGKFGVGENITNMIIGALIDTEQIAGAGDVKADRHVRKVLGRVFRGSEFAAKDAKECTEFARKIYPPNPWLLDQPLYFLGQATCKDRNPDCKNCVLRLECVSCKKGIQF